MQLALNAAWTPIFLGLERPGLAFAEILPLLAAVLAAALAFRHAHPRAALLLLPYAAWVGFASFLHLTPWQLNR